jgi:hypothetical protein
MVESKKKWPAVLGDTVEEIAESLRKQGARGIPGDPKNCIIARSYKLHYPDGWSGLRAGYDCRKDESNVIVSCSCSLSFNDPQIIDPQGSEALAEFMYRFDCGEFQDLIAAPIPKAKDVLAKLSTEERIAIGK